VAILFADDLALIAENVTRCPGPAQCDQRVLHSRGRYSVCSEKPIH
jgi:hypothetical protein